MILDEIECIFSEEMILDEDECISRCIICTKKLLKVKIYFTSSDMFLKTSSVKDSLKLVCLYTCTCRFQTGQLKPS